MNKDLQLEIFKALLDFEALGDIYEEKEIIILGCAANGKELKNEKIVLTTKDIQEKLKDFSLREINENTQILADKDFIKINRVTTTANETHLELLKSLCDLEEFLEDM